MTTLINLIFASPLNMVFFIIVEAIFFLGMTDIINALLSHTRNRHFIEFMEMQAIADELMEEDEEDVRL